MFAFSGFGEKAFALTASIARQKKRKRGVEGKIWKLDPSDPIPEFTRLPMEALERNKDYTVWYNRELNGIEYKPGHGITGRVKENDGLFLTFIIQGLERVLLKDYFSHGVSPEEWKKVAEWRVRQMKNGATDDEVP